MIDEFADGVDPKRVYVSSPTDFVFLCGGQNTDLSIPTPKSLRDAFHKITDFKPLKGSELIRAEDVEALHIAKSKYADLLSFETDLAQISKLVLLFSESFGSSAELGAFSVMPEIGSRMLVAMLNKHYEQTSFIKLGAIEYIRNRYGNFSFYVLDDKYIEIVSEKPTIATIEKLREVLEGPVSKRLAEIENPRTFNPDSEGHVIKLVVGLLQEFGALTVEEIQTLLIAFDLYKKHSDIERYLLCAEVSGWASMIRRGFHDFAVARDLPKDAANFSFLDKCIEKNARRRREIRRSAYKEKDRDRFLVILQGLR
ncbi:retron St85 family effector protein [Novosphingobium subterraneum]|uniref:retron St85 family effector protein n=1 Tax=Novosphingobium subterraneum TaxID=48936 RepID=UPI003D01935E